MRAKKIGHCKQSPLLPYCRAFTLKQYTYARASGTDREMNVMLAVLAGCGGHWWAESSLGGGMGTFGGLGVDQKTWMWTILLSSLDVRASRQTIAGGDDVIDLIVYLP